MRKTLCLFSVIFFLASVAFAADINWIEKTSMPVPVGAFGYAVVDGNIYIIGGDSSGSSMNTVQRYSPTTDTWELDTNHGGTLAPLPAPRAVLFCGVISRKIHAIGGWENGTYKGDHFIYDPDTNAWSTGPSIPQYPIGQFGATVNNKTYVFGGWWGTYKDYVFEYSEGTGWSAKSPMPTARNHGTTAVYDGKIYIIGGQGGQPAQQQLLDVVEIYDPETDTWTAGLAAMPSPQHWLGSSGCPVPEGIVYVLGPNNTAYGYDPQTDLWKTFKRMPHSAVGITAINDSIYAMGPEHTFLGVKNLLLEVLLTSVTLDPENSTGATTNAPGAWSTGTGDPLSQIGVMSEGVFLNQGAGSGTLGEISIPLRAGINTFTLFGNGTFPGNAFYGGVLFFNGVATPPQIAVYNANGTLGSFLVQPAETTIMGGANGGLFFDKAPGTYVYITPDGTKVEVLSFVINSMSSNIDKISYGQIGSNGTPDTTAQLILRVTLPPTCEGDFDNDGDVDGSDLAVFAADFGKTDCP